MSVRLVGIGSSHGDDAVGLEVVARLEAEGLPAGVAVLCCERPGVDLPELLAGAEAAVLVDAVRSGRGAGSVVQVPLSAVRRRGGVSSHALGVAEGLDLARALGHCPARLALVGVEEGGARHGALSPPVARAVPEAMALARRLLGDALAWHQATGGPGCTKPSSVSP